jgi:ATP-dependent DNA helicase PIF1
VTEGILGEVPLMLSRALTIHKLQGRTIPKVVVDIRQVFALAQVYVAISGAGLTNQEFSKD